MKKIKELNKNQKITVIITIAVFVVALFSLIKNISQVNKLKADITSLTIKDNNIILNVNSTKQKIINKTKETNISIISNNKELGNNEKISTGNILRYNNTDYEIVVKGDTNKDGNVDIGDLTKLYKIYMNKVEYTNVEGLAADVNSDNKIDISDLIGIYKVYKNPPEEIEDKETYTINFNSNGGSSVSSITRIFGEEIGTLPEPTRTGYTFDGWYTSSSGGTQISSTTKVLANTTYYAHWTGNKYYAFIYYINITVELTYGSPMPKLSTVPKRNGYTLAGLFDAQTGGTQYYNSSGTSVRNWDKTNYVTLYPHWTPNTYTVTYYGNGATGGSMAKSTHKSDDGTKLTKNSFTKAGYEFTIWNTKADGTGVNYKDGTSVYLTNNLNLYAQWEPKRYAITYDANGGSGSNRTNYCMADGSSEGCIVGSGTQNYRSDCYYVAGWSTTPNGSVQYTNDSIIKPTSDITLYAVWGYDDSTVNSSGTVIDPGANSNGICKDGVRRTGWVKLGTIWYYYKSGSGNDVLKGVYMLYSDGYYYWLDANNGIASTNAWTWEKSANGKWWFHDEDNSSNYLYSCSYKIINPSDEGTWSFLYSFNSSGWCIGGNGC